MTMAKQEKTATELGYLRDGHFHTCVDAYVMRGKTALETIDQRWDGTSEDCHEINYKSCSASSGLRSLVEELENVANALSSKITKKVHKDDT